MVLCKVLGVTLTCIVKTVTTIFQGSVNGGFQTVVRVSLGDEIPLSPSKLDLNRTHSLPHLYLT